MNMNNPLENLRQLTEAVRMAGADIAPTYIEYVQLAFAIANDCGEAGRNDFLSLCSLSSKYDEKNAQALFSTRFMPIKKIYIWEPCSIWPGNAE